MDSVVGISGRRSSVFENREQIEIAIVHDTVVEADAVVAQLLRFLEHIGSDFSGRGNTAEMDMEHG